MVEKQNLLENEERKFNGFEIKSMTGSKQFKTFNQITFEDSFKGEELELKKKLIFVSKEAKVLLFKNQSSDSRHAIKPQFLDLKFGDLQTNGFRKTKTMFDSGTLDFYYLSQDNKLSSVNLMTKERRGCLSFQQDIIDFVILPNGEMVCLLYLKRWVCDPMNREASKEFTGKFSIFRINLSELEEFSVLDLNPESPDLSFGNTLVMIDRNREVHDLRVERKKGKENEYVVMYQEKVQTFEVDLGQNSVNPECSPSGKQKLYSSEQKTFNRVSYFTYRTDSQHQIVCQDSTGQDAGIGEGNDISGDKKVSDVYFSQADSQTFQTNEEKIVSGKESQIRATRSRILNNVEVSNLGLIKEDFSLDYKKYILERESSAQAKGGETVSTKFEDAKPLDPTVLAFGYKKMGPQRETYYALYQQTFIDSPLKFWKIVIKEIKNQETTLRFNFIESDVPNENKHENDDYPFTLRLIQKGKKSNERLVLLFFRNKTLFVFDLDKYFDPILPDKSRFIQESDVVSGANIRVRAELGGTIVSSVPGEDIQHFFVSRGETKVYYVNFDKVHFYNLKFRTFEYTLNLGKQMMGARYNAEKNSIMYYTREESEVSGKMTQTYCEMNLTQMKLLRKVPVCLKKESWNRTIFVNKGITAEYMFVQKHMKGLRSVDLILLEEEPRMDFASFPYEDLVGMYSMTNFETHIVRFSEYYFQELERFGGEDNHFGPMSPLMACVYHNDHSLLRSLLFEYYYHKINDSLYIGPLEYAFRLNFRSCVSTICDYAIKQDISLPISYIDYQSLLRSNMLICHNLLANTFSAPEAGIMPGFAHQSDELKIKTAANLYELIHTDYEASERRKANIKQKKGVGDSLFAELDPVKEGDCNDKKAINTLQLPFKMDFRRGSFDSTLFLDKYSNSESDTFVYSEWSNLVKERWGLYKKIHICIALIYFIFTLFFTLRTVFYPVGYFGIREVLAIALTLLVLYELLQLISYCIFDFKQYLMSLRNIFDWMVIIATIINLAKHDTSKTETWFRIFTIIMMMLIYYRCFMYFTVFQTFRALIGMINIIIIKLVPFALVLVFFYIVTSIMMIYIDTETTHKLHFTNVYYWVLFGGIDDGAFAASYSVFAVAFGTLLVGIVLLNILIAYLSNVFSALEEQQNVDSMKGMAALSLDIELIISLFQSICSSHFRFKKTYRDHVLRRKFFKIDIANAKKTFYQNTILKVTYWVFINCSLNM